MSEGDSDIASHEQNILAATMTFDRFTVIATFNSLGLPVQELGVLDIASHRNKYPSS